MSVTDYLFVIVSICFGMVAIENRQLKRELSQPEVHCVQSQEIYDEGYHHGYSDGIDDGTNYENAVQYSDKLITDQVENPNLYQIDTDNPFK